MTMWEFEKIWVPVRDNLYPRTKVLNRVEASHLLREALGIQAIKEHSDYFRDMDYPMDEELKNVLLLLVGSHSHAILKAYRIRKGLEGA